MSNHARGLWGYSGRTASGLELTVQATGMGGPSAAVVLADLAKLGVKRVVRVGTCTGIAGRAKSGELLTVGEALAAGGSAISFGLDQGDTVTPDPELLARLESALGSQARTAIVASLDVAVAEGELPDTVAAADMQTVAVLARAAQLGIAAAAILIVNETGDETLEAAAKRAGNAATRSLSNPRP